MPVDAESEIESKAVKEFFSVTVGGVNCQLGGLAEFERELFTGLGWMASQAWLHLFNGRSHCPGPLPVFALFFQSETACLMLVRRRLRV